MVRVDSERCTGCGSCVDVCPVGAMELTAGVATIRHDLCNECQACIDACPQGAILSVVQGEIVSAERKIAVQRPVAVSIPAAENRGPAALGTVLAFVGREIVPRLATVLLEAWDRKGSATSVDPQTSGSVGAPSDERDSARGRRQRRHRGGRD